MSPSPLDVFEHLSRNGKTIRQSYYWQEKRRYILHARGHKCEKCGFVGPGMHVDTTNHQSLDMNDFRVLCSPCNNEMEFERGHRTRSEVDAKTANREAAARYRARKREAGLKKSDSLAAAGIKPPKRPYQTKPAPR